jgi:hypothetical protein
MTYPWAAGEVLTAADLNAYAGLVLVKTQTIGTAVSTVTVSNAFSSTFDAYRVIITGGTGSTTLVVGLQLGASTTGYYQSRITLTYATNTTSFGTDNNTAKWTVCGSADTNQLSADFTLLGVNLSRYTTLSCYYDNVSTGGTVTGNHKVATAYTGFTITTSTGTITGGTIRVYGYNNG